MACNRNIYIVTNGQVGVIWRIFNQTQPIISDNTPFTISSMMSSKLDWEKFKVPYWLDLNYSRIQIVFHDQIFNERSDLPTFNSEAIEMNLHHIPNLRYRFHIEFPPNSSQTFEEVQYHVFDFFAILVQIRTKTLSIRSIWKWTSIE